MREKKISWEKINSPLQKKFVERLNEEMRSAGLSDNALAALCANRGFPVGQTSISRITGGRQDPSLEVLYAISQALGLPAWFLLTDKDQVEERIIKPVSRGRQNVLELPPRYPKIFKEKQEVFHKLRKKRGK